MGHLIDRVHREVSDEDIFRIAGIYRAWRGEADAGEYQDIPGFCRSATIEEIASYSYVLTPGRYVGAEDIEDEDEPFDDKMARLTASLEKQFDESKSLETAIHRNLERLQYGN